MSVNGITGANDVYGTYSSASQTRNAAAKAENTGEAKATESAGVVYEPSNNKTASTKSYKPNTNVVAQMKADAEARTAQLQSLVQKMLTKQGETYNTANGIWGLLAQGKVKADPATIAQAKADIAEDGFCHRSDRRRSFQNREDALRFPEGLRQGTEDLGRTASCHFSADL